MGHLDFSGILMTLTGNMRTDFLDAVPEPYPIWNDLAFSGIPWAIYARSVKTLAVRDSTFRWRNAAGARQNAVRTQHVNTVQASNLSECRD